MEHKTQIIEITSPQDNPDEIEKAATMLKNGGLVVVPTETVYGIGANALDAAAAEKIFQAKKRPQDNPLIIHVSEIEMVKQLAKEIPPAAQHLMEAFWPGPLTIILPKTDNVPAVVSGGLDTVAVRMPAHTTTREIIRVSGIPIAAPSANLSGKPSPTTAQHCIQDLMGRVDLIVDGGACAVGVESTVISLTGEIPRLLRPGAVTVEDMTAVIGEIEIDAAVLEELTDDMQVSSPGMKYKHYAPKAQMELIDSSLESFQEFLQQQAAPGTFALVFEEDLQANFAVPALSYGPAENSAAQAHNLFKILRELDDVNAVKVYARTPPKNGVGMAVYNRLVRAAGFSERTL